MRPARSRLTRPLATTAAAAALAGCAALPIPFPLGSGAGAPQVPAPVFQRALESQPSGNRVTWRDPFGREQGTLTLVSTFRDDSGVFCRSFEVEMTSTAGWPANWSGIACRGEAGQWRPA